MPKWNIDIYHNPCFSENILLNSFGIYLQGGKKASLFGQTAAKLLLID
jgi:hypothetical protein